MRYKLKYLLILLLAKGILTAQTNDSLAFKLKPFFIGIELGRSPKLNFRNDLDYNFSNVTSKNLPFYSFSVGYNFHIYKNNFITPKIGFSTEYINYTIRDGHISNYEYQQVVGTQTNDIQSRVSELYVGTNKITINNALLSLDYQKYSSPFKNNKLKLCLNAGLLFKVVINTKSESTYSYTKDSLASSRNVSNNYYTSTNASLKNQFNIYNSNSEWHSLTPNIILGSSLLFDNKHLQHRLGLLLNVRLNFKYDSYIERQSNFLFLRLFYSITI